MLMCPGSSRAALPEVGVNLTFPLEVEGDIALLALPTQIGLQPAQHDCASKAFVNEVVAGRINRAISPPCQSSAPTRPCP